jgi:hypothetical protein
MESRFRDSNRRGSAISIQSNPFAANEKSSPVSASTYKAESLSNLPIINDSQLDLLISKLTNAK